VDVERIQAAVAIVVTEELLAGTLPQDSPAVVGVFPGGHRRTGSRAVEHGQELVHVETATARRAHPAQKVDIEQAAAVHGLAKAEPRIDKDSFALKPIEAIFEDAQEFLVVDRSSRPAVSFRWRRVR
jgi:hypothetical protein